MELKRLSQISGDARSLIGKHVIDLGCGSESNTDRFDWLKRQFMKVLDREELHRFDPWYCRVAHETGAHVMGVDIASNEKEIFQSVQLDLMDPRSLEFFKDASTDAVNNLCFTVPGDSFRAKSGTSPGVMKRLGMNREKAYELNDQVSSQVERILREGGVYTLSEFVFQKKKSGLQKVRTFEGTRS